tara:strand:- start:202 stop:792 length:591 start_codon:yes stop_codon:yes gene_type:complete
MTKIKSISIFCGAHTGKNPNFEKSAKIFTKIIAENNIDVVFGGGSVGLMNIISNVALEEGVKVTGILLKSLSDLELVNPNIHEKIETNSLLERKDEFMKRSDAFVVLPGGVGSMDELFEILANNQLGIINKPIGILNTDGYYNNLIAWFEKAIFEGFVSKKNFNEIIISDDPQKLVDMMLAYERPDADSWKDRLGL